MSTPIPTVELPLRRRMLQIVAENLAENSIRYAGAGATLTLSARPGVLEATDDGRGAEQVELDRGSSSVSTAATEPAPRAARVSVSRSSSTWSTAAGGEVEADRRCLVTGLTMRCVLPPMRGPRLSVFIDAFRTTLGIGEKSSFGPAA